MPGARDRRSLILEQAANLFAAKGIVATTVREIADAVGILSGSLYHHFKSKDEMVSAIVTGYLDDLVAGYEKIVSADSAPREKLADLVRTSLAVIEAHPHATEIYQNSGSYLTSLEDYDRISSAAATVQQVWLRVLEEGAASGDFRDDIPPRVLYRLLRDALWLSVRWFKPTRQYPARRLAEDFVSTFLDGITPR
ncbi:TetR/AcrR family transcriptional regulator [Amycolatopsis rhizosphaerae]|uniref:TetR/AcrR family transcriptional regulator n=1 Tax=Amycolatopsis rhizosphaerae TaxID=2053003 RepID=A0A558DCW3_9PSEU|nr:TetR/AcrR family transcriptional regulator [Amycolatopsis rhizosphaerae]TVT58875.1 TetR/AcrR family transcriptional regulator [Amycolatopsis rhizosphaerae]